MFNKSRNILCLYFYPRLSAYHHHSGQTIFQSAPQHTVSGGRLLLTEPDADDPLPLVVPFTFGFGVLIIGTVSDFTCDCAPCRLVARLLRVNTSFKILSSSSSSASAEVGLRHPLSAALLIARSRASCIPRTVGILSCAPSSADIRLARLHKSLNAGKRSDLSMWYLSYVTIFSIGSMSSFWSSSIANFFISWNCQVVESSSMVSQ